MIRSPLKQIFTILILGWMLAGAQSVDSELRKVNAEQPKSQQIQAPQAERLQGYQEWKQKRIIKARTDINLFKSPENQALAESSPAPSSSEGPAPSEDLQKTKQNQELNKRAERLRQLEFNLEIALGLTIHDYFALYLKDKSKEEIAQVVGKLNPDELSELLVSYRDALYGAPIPDKTSDSNLR